MKKSDQKLQDALFSAKQGTSVAKAAVQETAERFGDTVDFFITHTDAEYNRIVRENVMGLGAYLSKMSKESRPLLVVWMAFFTLALGSLFLEGSVRLFVFIIALSVVAFGLSAFQKEKGEEGFHIMDVFWHLRKGHSHDLWKELDAARLTVVAVGRDGIYHSKVCKSDTLKVFKIDYEEISEIDSRSWLVTAPGRPPEKMNEFVLLDQFGRDGLYMANFAADIDVDVVAELKQRCRGRQ